MTYNELQLLAPAWRQHAETHIWHPTQSNGEHPSFNTCEESSRVVMTDLYDNYYLEPELSFGSLKTEDSTLKNLEDHFWPEVEVSDRDELVIIDLTIAQTGYGQLPLICHTRSELATLGLYYARRSTKPYYY